VDTPPRIRPAVAADEPFLWSMALATINWLPGRVWTPDRLRADPATAHYVEGWPRPGDFGVVAEADDGPVGAAWFRCFPVDDPGYGFVAADVPELGIAVVAEHRGRGLGRALLRAAHAAAAARGIPRLSLSVERANPALALYESEGYRRIADDGDSTTMVRG
jgi:GNAT superfamily N-acetyltransferase